MLTQNTIVSALPATTDKVFIAFSGGVDSHVLLHLISTIDFLRSKVTAVYINHGLQDEADLWASHCELVAANLGVKFLCVNVNAQKIGGKSPEEIAREARYSAFKSILDSHDVLLLAQHREDQMETVLLQLFRGAGVSGLSGMPLSNSFGAGIMLRPFLDISKKEIMNYAENNNLQWIEDPSNLCVDFDRNFLRNQIIPQLKQRWPALDKTVARSARHCANDNHITQNLAKQLLNSVIDKKDQALGITHLLALNIDEQYLVIRQWFAGMKLRMPSEKRLEIILNEVVKAKVNANPKIQEQGRCISRYRNKLYCLNMHSEDWETTDIFWPEGVTQLNFKQGGSLVKIDSSNGIPKALWNNSEVYIKFRKGSEKIRLPGRNGHHSLKKLFQEKAIPPWERPYIPLIYLDGRLASVADLWMSADFYSAENEGGYKLSWRKK